MHELTEFQEGDTRLTCTIELHPIHLYNSLYTRNCTCICKEYSVLYVSVYNSNYSECNTYPMLYLRITPVYMYMYMCTCTYTDLLTILIHMDYWDDNVVDSIATCNLDVLTTADLRLKLKSSEDRCQVAESQKTELEVQISQLSEMSGDSSKQMAYLNDQLREKDRQVEELQGQHSSVTEEMERVRQEQSSKAEKLVSHVYMYMFMYMYTCIELLPWPSYVYMYVYMYNNELQWFVSLNRVFLQSIFCYMYMYCTCLPHCA